MFGPDNLPSFLGRPSRRQMMTGLGAALMSSSAMPAFAHAGTKARPEGLLPEGFDPAYIHGAIRPFAEMSTSRGAPLLTQMIDAAFSKEGAIPPHLWGMLYEGWRPAMEEEGLSVFLQGLERRGEDNARKRIYMSALTPDLYEAHYRPKVINFLQGLFREGHEGAPLMRRYYDGYWDMFWDLHLGVRGDDIPDEVRAIGDAFNAVIGFWDPRREVVYENYMRVRALREPLRAWIDARVKAVVDGEVEHPEATFVHYWAINGAFGPDFRRKDIVFECFHNFLAFSQWGNTLYQIMDRLTDSGDEAIRSAYRRTMEGSPDAREANGFTPLDRLVMELFRVISPNTGSLSSVEMDRDGVTGAGYIFHAHPEANLSPRHWDAPDAFDPGRFRGAVTAAQADDAHCRDIGLARCPFSEAPTRVADGRALELASSGFGTVHARLEGEPLPLADMAGYAPFGFGYRRCAGEWLTVDFVKDALRLAWSEQLSFVRLPAGNPAPLPVGPGAVIQDNVGFVRPA